MGFLLCGAMGAHPWALGAGEGWGVLQGRGPGLQEHPGDWCGQGWGSQAVLSAACA